MGIQDYKKKPNRRDPFQSHLWHWSSNSSRSRNHQLETRSFPRRQQWRPTESQPGLLDESRERASRKMSKHQTKMSEYYNRRVKLRRLNIGDLVLRKVTPATKNPTQEKLGPTWEGPYKVTHYSRQGSYHLEMLDGRKLPWPWNIKHLKQYH